MGKAERRRAVLLVMLVFLVDMLSQCGARSWASIVSVQDVKPIDISAQFFLHLEGLLFESKVVASAGSPLTVDMPLNGLRTPPTTTAPSPSPSALPSSPPTGMPSTSPTRKPTATPTVAPTIAPTVDPFKPNAPPLNPDDSYFNYDVSSQYGPGELALIRESSGIFQVDEKSNHWGQVARPLNDYWKEFTREGFGPWKQILDIYMPERNVCATGKLQSPIDIRENGAVCAERHMVRHLPGDFQVSGPHVEKRIESNKLRLVFERRPCADLNNTACEEPDPPKADFPHGWPGIIDAIHVDFKLPSEHTIRTERFDAEMQIYYIHPSRRRLAAQSVLIRATTDGYNYYLQAAIDAFQEQYDKNAANCGRHLREARQMVTDAHRILGPNVTSPFVDYLSWAKFSSGVSAEDWLNHSGKNKFEGGPWDLFNEMLIPTIYFYRYDGSLTEPPCGEFVSWWIADKPMIISVDQLEQLKRILFTNVDSNCKKTSVQFGRSVARPVRQVNNRAVWKCTSANFGPDAPSG